VAELSQIGRKVKSVYYVKTSKSKLGVVDNKVENAGGVNVHRFVCLLMSQVSHLENLSLSLVFETPGVVDTLLPFFYYYIRYSLKDYKLLLTHHYPPNQT